MQVSPNPKVGVFTINRSRLSISDVLANCPKRANVRTIALLDRDSTLSYVSQHVQNRCNVFGFSNVRCISNDLITLQANVAYTLFFVRNGFIPL